MGRKEVKQRILEFVETEIAKYDTDKRKLRAQKLDLQSQISEIDQKIIEIDSDTSKFGAMKAKVES